MSSLTDLEQLRSEISILEARLQQLEEPGPATSLEGLPTAEILGQIQKTTEAERARLEERQNLQLALPVLKERLSSMEKECEKVKKELEKALTSWQKLSMDVKSGLEEILAKIDTLKSESVKVQRLYSAAYGNNGLIFQNHWQHQFDYPFLFVRQDPPLVVLTTESQRSHYERR